MEKLTVVVLAGGEGKRLWPMSTDKALFPFLGKPLIEYCLSRIPQKKLTSLIVVTNSVNDEYIKSSLMGRGQTIVQKSPGGMADAIMTSAPIIDRDSSLLIVNGDDVTDGDVIQMVLDESRKSGAFGVLPAWKPSSYLPLGYLKLDGDSVVAISEKPGAGHEPSPLATLGSHWMRKSGVLLSAIENTKSDTDDVYEQALGQLMVQEKFIMAPYDGKFATLKYPWHILDIQDIFLHGCQEYRGRDVTIKSNVVIEGAVYISDHVTICENTKITGPCFIGPHTIIGNNNIIRHSAIGSSVVTGFNTDITRSYIGDNCWFHTNYIGDSVLESNVSMGSGAVLANLRLDEKDIYSKVNEEIVHTSRNKFGAMIGKNVRIGVNTSVMPGIKIGKNSFVGSGIVLTEDLPDNSYCSLQKQNYIVKTNNATIKEGARAAFKKRL